MEQALLFDRRRYNQRTAQSWAKSHGYKPIKYHTTDRYVRARLQPPIPGGNYRLRHVQSGVKAIVGGSARLRGRTMLRPVSRAAQRRRGGGILDSNPALLENLVTTALTGLAIFGIVKAVKARK